MLGSVLATARAAKAEVNSVAGSYAGSAGDVANKVLFPGFKQSFIKTSGATINTLVGGSGPPLLLLHGHPETHVTWHKVSPRLAQRFTLVLTDLRGYGDSSKPEGGDDHANYSKRAMGNDQVEVMNSLGFSKFQVLAHDRGARVLHRMMLDHQDAITRGAMLDVAPTDKMYAQTNETFATKYFWWFFPHSTRAFAGKAHRRFGEDLPEGSSRRALPHGRSHNAGMLRGVFPLSPRPGLCSRGVRGLSRLRHDRYGSYAGG